MKLTAIPDHLAAAFGLAIAPNERLVAAARAAHAPVVFTRVVYGAKRANGAKGDVFYRKVQALRRFDEGSWLGAFPRLCNRPPAM